MRSFRFTRPFAPILVFASSMIALSTQSLVHAQKPIEQTPPPIAQEAIKKQTEADPGKPVQSTGSLLFKPGGSPQDRVRSERTEARDYRHGGVTTTKSPVKTLPLFGYDLFKSAREAVDNSRKFHQLQAQKDFKSPSCCSALKSFCA